MKVTQLFNKYWLLIILILQPILDIIAYFNFKTNITPITFVLRSAILLFTIVYTFIKSKNKKNFILCMLPIAVFSLLHLGNSYRVGMLSLFSDLRYLIFVIQLPILTICFIDYIKWNKECLKLLKSAFVINTLLIFFSLILAIWSGDFAYTYYNYGLTGWFSSANTQSMILVAITPLFLYFSTRNKNVILYILNHAIVFFLLFLNGTKACYIALLIIYIAMIYISLVSEKGKLRIYKTLVSIMSLSLVLFFGNDSATFKRLDDVNDVTYKNEVTIKEKIKEKIDKLDKPSNIEEDNPSEEDIEYNIYDLENYSDDIIIDILNDSYIWEDIISIHGGEKVLNKIRDDLTPAALSDNRLRKRVNASIYFDESDICTKLVGFEFTKVSDFDLENDLTAIFYYYGYLGFGLYSLFILYFGWLLFKMFWRDKKIIFDGEFVMYGITLVLLIFGGEYSGAFLRKSNANIYLSCLLALIYFKYHREMIENLNVNQEFDKNLKSEKKLVKHLKRIKILMLHLGYGGVEKQTITMANSLASKYNIEIVSFYKLSEKPAYAVDKRISIKYLYNGKPNKIEFKNALKKFRLFRTFKEGIKALNILRLKKELIKKEILNDNADIYFSTRPEYGILLSKYGNRNKLKITQEHNFIDDSKYQKHIIKGYKNLDYVIVISKYHEKMYNEWFKNSQVKIKCVENMLDVDSKVRSKLNNNAIIAVGRFDPIKDFSSLIDVMDYAVKKNPSLKLYLLGDGEEKNSLINKIREFKLEKNIIMPGFVPSEKVKEYELKSDLYIMTSLRECFPMVLLEAYNLGLPVISFDILTGPKEIIKNSKTGYLIENRDNKKMAKKINEILKNQNKLKELSDNAYEESKKYYKDNVIKKWYNIFK